MKMARASENGLVSAGTAVHSSSLNLVSCTQIYLSSLCDARLMYARMIDCNFPPHIKSCLFVPRLFVNLTEEIMDTVIN